jgi:CheY-like chemotaxis protein
MRILIADDDPVSRRILEAKLVKWGYETIVAYDGNEAWQILQSDDPPSLAILNWMMPGMEGVEVCRKLRQKTMASYCYIIILTALDKEDDIVVGMEAGADDYLVKPFRPNELWARLRAGKRILDMQNELLATGESREKLIFELREALARIKTLSGMLPICAACKKIRDDKGYWNQLEVYFSEHADVLFSHCLCPDCADRAVKDFDELKRVN